MFLRDCLREMTSVVEANNAPLFLFVVILNSSNCAVVHKPFVEVVNKGFWGFVLVIDHIDVRKPECKNLAMSHNNYFLTRTSSDYLPCHF